MIERLLTLLEERAVDLEAPWFLLFAPADREHDSELELFVLTREMSITYEDLSPSSPVGVPVYEGAYAARGAGMACDAFARGAAAVATLVDPNQADQVAELLNRMLENVEERGFYPALSKRYVERYAAVAVAIMENGEPVGIREQLAFNLGAWWLVGHLKEVGKVRIGVTGRSRSTAVAFIEGALMKRAVTGLVYV